MLKPETPAAAPTSAPARPLLHAAALLLAGLLLPLVCLRENPHFWTNAGGYPQWLRRFVELTYYPLLLTEVALLACLSWSVIRRRPSPSRRLYLEVTLLVLLWAVVAVVATMMLTNNISNVIEGRPLHSH